MLDDIQMVHSQIPEETDFTMLLTGTQLDLMNILLAHFSLLQNSKITGNS